MFLFICNSVVFNAACSTFYDHKRAAFADVGKVAEPKTNGDVSALFFYRWHWWVRSLFCLPALFR